MPKLNFYSSFFKFFFQNVVYFLFILLIFTNYIQKDHLNIIKFNSKNQSISNYDAKIIFAENISITNLEKFTKGSCQINNDMHDRHQLRWIFPVILKNLNLLLYSLNQILPYYFHIFLFSVLIFFSYLILNKTFKSNYLNSLTFLLFISFIFSNYLGEYEFSIRELLLISLAIYASKFKKYYLFISICVLAALNRESGFLCLMIWLIFNKDLKKFFIFSVITFLLFLVVNKNLISCIFNYKFYAILTSPEGQINLNTFELSYTGLVSYVKLIVLNFLLPFGLFFYFYFLNKVQNKLLLINVIIYLIIFLIVVPAHHVAARLLLLPYIYLVLSKKPLKN